ncbi:AMP-dependent synthetase [Thermocladium modestius]|uniref:acetate--CoA ligase n=1 Tax=Thermocladium modestius TaxID=62609 RepID=A0A830GU44_9CREN|nr:AMP-binding protein [Thermocladium modestius]GGP20653.1 AMP-dependent synthetase [Thermocladium modestius]
MKIWKPSKDNLSESNVARFMVEEKQKDLDEFIESTYSRPEWFWDKFVNIIGIKWNRKYSKVLDLSKGKPWARWFIDGKLNIADQLMDGSDILIKWENELGDSIQWSYSYVLYRARAVSSWLHRNGLRRGDRVAIYMPMIPEIVPIFLGIIRAGGVVVPLFSGFGHGAIRTRLEDSETKFVFASDSSIRKGKQVDMLGELKNGLTSTVKNVILLNRSGKRLDDYVDAGDMMRTGGDHVEDTDSEDPLMILYTSGTTGKPKGTVHTHDGFPIKAAADIYFHFDMKRGDTLMWVTDLGWMMGPWMIFGGYLLRGSIALFEGVPDYPGPDRLWEFVNNNEVNILGLSATLIRLLRSEGSKPAVDPVKAFGNTGEAIDLESWEWLYDAGNGSVPIINYSGGTEVSGGLVGCYVVKPIKPSSFNGASPGIKVAILDVNGKPVPPNTEGELSVLSVWPGMTRGFWRDTNRYLETYWSKIEGVWSHGDGAMYDEDGYIYIVGRIDDTIKVAGKRLGPAEIETIINSNPNVIESACIGIPDELKGETVMCFVVPRQWSGLEELKIRLIEEVANSMGKAFAPRGVVFVKALPKTRNAKIMRRVIRSIYLGKDPGDLSSLDNPDAVEEIRKALKST